MYEQSRIFESVTSAAGEARIRLLTAAESFANRTALGRRVCEEFGFLRCAWPAATGELHEGAANA